MTFPHTPTVLHVHCRYREPGGEDAVVATERDLLRSSGWTVVEHNAANPSAPMASAARLALAPWNPASYVAIQRAAQDSGADIAHVHNTWFSLSPSIVEGLHRAGIPVVMTVHNYRLACVNGLLYRDGQPCTDCVGRSPLRGVVHRCYRGSALSSSAVASTLSLNRMLSTWRRCVRCFVVLNDVAGQVVVATGVPADRVVTGANHVVDHGVRRHRPSESRELLYVGRLAFEKGIDLLLDAWRMWRPDETWNLTIVGDGPLRPALEDMADRRVRFVGHLEATDVAARLRTARALVLPSVVYENQPMVSLEAFAAGLPVLGRGFGGIRQVIRVLGDAWMVPASTVDEWRNALDIVRNPAEVDRAGAVARDEFERNYSVTAARAQLTQLYSTVITEP